MTNQEYKYIIKRQVGQNLTGTMTHCRGCDKPIDINGDHCHCCPVPAIRSPTCIHESAKKGVAQAFQETLKQANHHDIHCFIGKIEPNIMENGIRPINNNANNATKRADLLLSLGDTTYIVDITTSSNMRQDYIKKDYNSAQVAKKAEETKRKSYSNNFDIINIPEGIKFVAFGIDTLGGWGPEAINFMKHICNQFPPDISCRLKYKWKMIISTFIKRGQRYSTEKVKHQLSYRKEALPFPVMG